MYYDADDVLYESYQKLKIMIVKILVGEYNYESDKEIIEMIRELNERNVNFKNRLKKEINREKNQEIYELKVQLGKEKSEWKKRGNSYSRWNPNGLEFETCILPINFDIKKMEIIENDEIFGKIRFKYPNDVEKTKQKDNWIYIELYDFLNNKPRAPVHKEMKDLKIESIKTWEDMKEYMISKNVSPGKYIKEMGIFLLNLEGDTFTLHDINQANVFNNRKTRRIYIKKFIDLGLIEETKTIGAYRKKF
jgi:hypothetical protein